MAAKSLCSLSFYAIKNTRISHIKLTYLTLPLNPIYGFVPPLSLSCLPQTLGQKHGSPCSCPFSSVPYPHCEAARAIEHSGCFYKQLLFCTSPLKWHLSLSTLQGATRSQELTHFSALSLGEHFWVPVWATHLIKMVVILKLSRANCLFLLFIQITILQHARS